MAANVTLYVNPDELKSKAGEVEEKVNQYKQCYDKIYSEVEKLASTWSGDANKAFVTQIEGFRSDFENLHKLLSKFSEFLTVASNNYERTENMNIENARTIPQL